MPPPCCSVVDDRDFLNHEVVGITIKNGFKVIFSLSPPSLVVLHGMGAADFHYVRANCLARTP
jgi:hypothetical protein